MMNIVKLTPLVILLPILAFAEDTTPFSDFLTETYKSIGQFGGLPWVGKMAIIIAIMISSMKVDAIRHLLWDKLGSYKPLAAPVIGLIGGLVSLASIGSFSWPSLAAYVFAGAGAVLLNQMMSALEGLPWFGAKYVAAIKSIMGAFGSKQ
jgi:hypothetical protein